MTEIRATIIGHRETVERLRRIVPDVRAELRKAIERQTIKLSRKTKAEKLSGQVLNVSALAGYADPSISAWRRRAARSPATSARLLSMRRSTSLGSAEQSQSGNICGRRRVTSR